MRTMLLLLIVACFCLHNSVASDVEEQFLFTEFTEYMHFDEVEVIVDVDITDPLNHVEEYFISFNIDCQEFSEHFEKLNFRLIYLCPFAMLFRFIVIFYGSVYSQDGRVRQRVLAILTTANQKPVSSRSVVFVWLWRWLWRWSGISL